MTTADADGNVVAMTQTINNLFGSKATVPGTGILLNNTMALFDPHPGTPASIAPGKRVTSSMAPTIVFREGKPAWALGLPGGVRIFTSVFQAVVNLIDHGMTLQQAVEAPRVWSQGQELEMEQDIPAAIRDAVAARGHRVVAVPAVAGGMNAVAFAGDGTLEGAACWRADGTPIGVERRAGAAGDPLQAGRESPARLARRIAHRPDLLDHRMPAAERPMPDPVTESRDEDEGLAELGGGAHLDHHAPGASPPSSGRHA